MLTSLNALQSKFITSLHESGDTVFFDTDDVNYTRKGIYWTTRNVCPRWPQNAGEMYDYEQSASLLTCDRDSFVLRADCERNLIVFSCFSNLRTLCEGSILYVDGIFQFNCQFFSQFFIVQDFNNGYYIPLIFALINSKHMLSYRKYSKELKRNVLRMVSTVPR